MKTLKWMFTIISVMLVLAVTFTACSTGDKTTGIVHTDPTSTSVATEPVTEPVITEPVVEKTISEQVWDSLSQIVLSGDAETIRQYLTEDCQDMAESFVDTYPGTAYEVTVEAAGEFEDYLLFYYSIIGVEGDDRQESGVTIFKKGDSVYQLCTATDVINRLVSEKQCGSCSGSGSVYTGGNICGLCGGTGQTYNPAVYFDSFTQMWQGMWQACGGCGGAGSTGGFTSICGVCFGHGLDLH